MADMLGYPPSEMIGRPLSEFVDERDRARAEADLLEYRSDAGQQELRLARKRGGLVWAIASTSALGGEAGAIAMVTDITERKAADRALRVSERRYRALSDTAVDAIVSADQSGVITYVNPAAERIFGCEASEMVGSSLTCLMPERFRDAHSAGIERFLATGHGEVVGKTVEPIGMRGDGSEFPLDLSLGVWADEGGAAFTGIMRDVTERKRAEEDSRRFRQLFEQTRGSS